MPKQVGNQTAGKQPLMIYICTHYSLVVIQIYGGAPKHDASQLEGCWRLVSELHHVSLGVSGRGDVIEGSLLKRASGKEMLGRTLRKPQTTNVACHGRGLRPVIFDNEACGNKTLVESGDGGTTGPLRHVI